MFFAQKKTHLELVCCSLCVLLWYVVCFALVSDVRALTVYCCARCDGKGWVIGLISVSDVYVGY